MLKKIRYFIYFFPYEIFKIWCVMLTACSIQASHSFSTATWVEATVLRQNSSRWYTSSKCTSYLLDPFHSWQPHCHLKPSTTERKLLTFQTRPCSLLLLVIPPALEATVSEIWFLLSFFFILSNILIFLLENIFQSLLSSPFSIIAFSTGFLFCGLFVFLLEACYFIIIFTS